MKPSLYQRLCQFWAIVFIIVGLTFIFSPNNVSTFLTTLAHTLGLSGTIPSAAGTLWHILTISLMSAVTVCAYYSAKHPHDEKIYRTLVIAKWVSTIGFAINAYYLGSAWIVCMLGDGFVAITLMITRAHWRKSQPSTDDFANTYLCQAPYYEVWYGKINIAPGQAFWFRYTLSDGTHANIATWAIHFANNQITTAKSSFPLKELSPCNHLLLTENNLISNQEPQVFHRGDIRLDRKQAIGYAKDIKWNLTFEDSQKRFLLFPKWLYQFGFAKSFYASHFLDLNFSGMIQIKQTTYEIKNAKGMMGHIYGKKHAQEWAWAHCNVFTNAGADNVVFEGISARVKMGPWLSPVLSSFVCFVNDTCYTFSGFWKLTSASSCYGNGKWQFKTQANGVSLSGELIADDPTTVALVEYRDPDNTPLWCRNSKLASLKLHLQDPNKNIDKVFIAENTAAFELVDRQKPQGEIHLSY